MQRRLFALTATAAVFLLHAAGSKADFSGTWSMDPARSESAHQAVPIGPVTLVIRQTESELSIETRRTGNDKSSTSSETLTWKLDGSESGASGDSSDASIKTRARWDGPKLVTETARNLHGTPVTVVHVLSLDPTGKVMTIDKTLTVQHGYQAQGAKNTGTGKDVFVKASR